MENALFCESGMVVFSLLSMIPATRPCLYKAWDKFVSNMKDKTLFANSIGAFICGCGMTLAGSVRTIQNLSIYLHSDIIYHFDKYKI